jgi:hypothetical protein
MKKGADARWEGKAKGVDGAEGKRFLEKFGFFMEILQTRIARKSRRSINKVK